MNYQQQQQPFPKQTNTSDVDEILAFGGSQSSALLQRMRMQMLEKLSQKSKY